MPYRIRKLPKKDLYKVYGEDGTPHSKEGLTLEMAKKQMTALNIAHARKEGHTIPRADVKFIKMPVDDYVKEHKHLIKILDAAGKEGRKQRNELMGHI